jgi:hypothetical protein
MYVDKRARKLAEDRYAEAIRGELAVFKVDLMATLNVRSQGADVTGAEIARRLGELEHRGRG